MRRLKILLLLCFLLILLSGCSQASQAEDQAYVLVMGLDQTAEGQMQMSVLVPRISGKHDESNSGGGSENYMHMSVKADDFEGALEKLDWASPRNVNLAQMKLIVISKELADSNECLKLIENIAQTERLFTATKVAVCQGDAKEFVKAIRPNIGTRISTDIESMFSHYNDHGYLPESSLAELYYQTASVYSDPMVAYAILEDEAVKKEDAVRQASAFSQNLQKLSASYDSEIPTRYLGAAVFSNGRMQCLLNGGQTVFTNLLRNELDSFRYECDGQNLEFVPTRPVYIHVDTRSTPVLININMALSFAAQEKIPSKERLKTKLTDDLLSVLQYTQEMNVEPFGLAERAARCFMTISEWVDFDWKKHYREAEFEIELQLAQSDA